MQTTLSIFPRKKLPTYKLGILGSAFAIFMIVLIWIMEAIFYANEKRRGFYGVKKWK